MSYVRLPVVLAVICALLPAAAQGQAGNRPDPDSPAGVEYQLPLDQARKNAAGGDGDKPDRGGSRTARPGDGDKPDRGGSRTARPGAVPLFGAGIVARKGGGDRADESGAGGGQGERASGAGSRASGAGGEDSGAGGAASGDPTVRQSAVGIADSDDGSATLRIAGIALAVLLAGGLLGLGLRRGLRQTRD